MRLNSMLATVLIFLCSLVISSCSNDELAPISLKNRETANIKLNYPNNQTYSFPLQGGDGNYEISCDKPEIIETKMISSCDISIKALALGEAIITVRDQSGNTLDIHVIVDYYTDNYIVSKQDILLTGDLKDSEKQAIKEKALATIPVKTGGGYKFIYTDAEIARGKVLVYQEKNVGIVLWLTWLTVENNFDLFKTFNEWGVKGLKIDFMDRSDQWMVNYYERVAREAAKHHLFVDFHGSFKPAGLEYKYPNVLSYEGVRGMEQMGGCYPDNSLYLPFMRNAVGPMDYTPGAMISMQPNVYRSERPNAASIGTRAYQLALFVVFESGLQMLADNPTLYYRNEDCTRFITQVPVTWDETVALEAKAGEYVVVAKRKGDKWFIGGMTNNGEKEREFTIKLDFLNKDRSYQMTSFEDGINAGRQAMDYRCKSSQVKAGEQLAIKMVRNGGFAAVIE